MSFVKYFRVLYTRYCFGKLFKNVQILEPGLDKRYVVIMRDYVLSRVHADLHIFEGSLPHRKSVCFFLAVKCCLTTALFRMANSVEIKPSFDEHDIALLRIIKALLAAGAHLGVQQEYFALCHAMVKYKEIVQTEINMEISKKNGLANFTDDQLMTLVKVKQAEQIDALIKISNLPYNDILAILDN